jgi:hypothetical protein
MTTIEEMEAMMFKLPQADAPIKHYFGPGVYIREVYLPGGTWTIGHHQNFVHLNVMISGHCKMIVEGKTWDLKAPLTYVSPPGRKYGYVAEDTIWQNIYANPTNEQDIEKLETHFLTKSTLSLAYEKAHLDYMKLTMERGLSEEQVQKQVNAQDMIELPYGCYKFQMAPSNIQGQGIFATDFIVPGEVIGPARIGDKRTILGRMVNHDPNPNAKMVWNGGNIELVAIHEIKGKKGTFLGDEITTDYRETQRIL